MSPLSLAGSHAQSSLAQSSNDAGVFAAFGGLWLLFVVLGLALTAFWIWMLVDLLGSSAPTNEKILWAIIMLVVPLIGSILYFVMQRGKGRDGLTGPARSPRTPPGSPPPGRPSHIPNRNVAQD